MNRNRVPVSAWLKLRSDSIRGARGAGVIRAVKLRKNIEVKIRIGPMVLRKVFAELCSAWPGSVASLFLRISNRFKRAHLALDDHGCPQSFLTFVYIY